MHHLEIEKITDADYRLPKACNQRELKTPNLVVTLIGTFCLLILPVALAVADF